MSTATVKKTGDLLSDMAAANLQPLWKRFRELASIEPQPTEAPVHWRWAEVQGFVERAAREISMVDAERRVLLLASPHRQPGVATVGGLVSAVQILEAGETAEAHRHSAAAIRVILEAKGGATIINGRRYEMLPGDLILTPSMCWHGHINDSGGRVVWLDGLDVPLVRNMLDAHFFEPLRAPEWGIASAKPSDESRWTQAGLVPGGVPAALHAYSPKFRYPWQDAVRALEAMPDAPDGSRLLRYVNPETGAAVMPTLECQALQLQRGAATRRSRQTANSICVVIEGEGRSTVGDSTLEWSRHDVFTVPRWHWASHCAQSPQARLFQLSDREMLARLDLLREEFSD